jgi:hypothetical protein
MRIPPFFVLLAPLLALAPSQAFAQSPAHNLDELRLKVKVGDTIYVTDESGRERSGRIDDLSPTVLTVSFGGMRRELPESSILRIRKRQSDSLWTGGAIGAGIGLALGVTAATFSEECSHNKASSGCIGPVLSMTGLATGVGIGVDALIQGRKVIYEASGFSLRVSPWISPGRLGVRLSVQLPAGP